MSNTIIQVENLGKKYVLGHQQEGRSTYKSLRETISNGAKLIGSSFFRTTKRPEHLQKEEFWALRDISFSIQQGDRVGIIGRNGAGKSTILKVLSRITEPSTGQISIKGRVASLLEVGTGFHPELTGRENIFLNGAILGMSKQEIKSKFDEIVDFSEIEKFLDTPVKRYSSGMYVRLAFAVAAHLEPEILVVDEVLAVGDIAFQKKCLGKMENVAKEGRTVLFVSHNMAAVQSLCSSGIVLSHGEKVFEGKIRDSVRYYLDSLTHINSNEPIKNRKDRKGRGIIRAEHLEIQDQDGMTGDAFPIGTQLNFIIQYLSAEIVKNPQIIISIYDSANTRIARMDSDITGLDFQLQAMQGTIVCSLTEALTLSPGRYHLNIALLNNRQMEDQISRAMYFDILDSDYFGTGRIHESGMTKVFLKHTWKHVG